IDLHVDGMHLLGKLQAVAKRIWDGRHPAANLAIPGGACRWPDAMADRNPSQSLRRAATSRKGFAPKPAARPANTRARTQAYCPSRRSDRSSHLPESRLGIPAERSFPAERPSPGSGQQAFAIPECGVAPRRIFEGRLDEVRERLRCRRRLELLEVRVGLTRWSPLGGRKGFSREQGCQDLVATGRAVERDPREGLAVALLFHAPPTRRNETNSDVLAARAGGLR